MLGFVERRYEELGNTFLSHAPPSTCRRRAHSFNHLAFCHNEMASKAFVVLPNSENEPLPVGEVATCSNSTNSRGGLRRSTNSKRGHGIEDLLAEKEFPPLTSVSTFRQKAEHLGHVRRPPSPAPSLSSLSTATGSERSGQGETSPFASQTSRSRRIAREDVLMQLKVTGSAAMERAANLIRRPR